MRIFLFFSALIISSVACNIERVLDPSLPTASAEILEPSPEAIIWPTSTPAVTLERPLIEANQAFFFGDWESALDLYNEALRNNSGDQLQGAAYLGVGRTHFELQDWENAKDRFKQVIVDFPDSNEAIDAFFFLAKTYTASGNFSEASIAYSQYLELSSGSINSKVFEWLGDAHFANGGYEAAIEAYQQAESSPRLSDNKNISVKIGDAYLLSGDYQNAILTFQNVYLSSANDYLKAQMDLSMGRAYAALGQIEQAYPLYLDAVENFPLAYSSYAALVELVDDGIAVNEFDRGLVDYYAATSLEASGDSLGAAELYSVAIAAFDRFLLANSELHSSTVHHFRALSLRSLGEYSAAIQEWEGIISDHSFDNYWAESYAQLAFTQWAYLDDFDGGIKILEDFIAATPGQSRSAEYLYTAGRIAERNNNLAKSVELWLRVGAEYSNSEYAFRSVFLAGVSQYRLGEIGAAEASFSHAVNISQSLEDQSQAMFWVGKSQRALGQENDAIASWEETSQLDPSGYYSERAAAIVNGELPFEAKSEISFVYNAQSERDEAEKWMRERFNLPPESDLTNPGKLAEDPRYKRGQEFWRLGEYELARAEFESLRLSVIDDPADSFRLANALIKLGMYRTGIFAARQVLSIAGMSDAETFTAPIYFNRLRFGTYYKDLVIEEADSDGLNPLFVFSVMRQESLFEGFVTSSAGARGLMQIIPSTGQEIATLSGWPENYSADDLYRPVVSIGFGTDYLSRQLNNFDGNLYAALAAYNAGPSRASYWSSIDQDDLDLFLELIHFPETKEYVRSIYELFTIYSNLYSKP